MLVKQDLCPRKWKKYPFWSSFLWSLRIKLQLYYLVIDKCYIHKYYKRSDNCFKLAYSSEWQKHITVRTIATSSCPSPKSSLLSPFLPWYAQSISILQNSAFMMPSSISKSSVASGISKFWLYQMNAQRSHMGNIYVVCLAVGHVWNKYENVNDHGCHISYMIACPQGAIRIVQSYPPSGSFRLKFKV